MDVPFDFNEHQRKHEFTKSGTGYFRVMPRITCADGFSLSVQSSEFHYCLPRVALYDHYTHVEVGFPSEPVPELMEWIELTKSEPTDSVYGYVPVEVVNAVINAHGGLKL